MDARRITASAVILFTVLAAPLAGTTSSSASGTTDRVAGPDRDSRLLPTRVHGKAAISALGDDLDLAAARNHMTSPRLRDLLANDATAWLDGTGRVYYVEPTLDASEAATSAPRAVTGKTAAPYRLEHTFQLHSNPGSEKTIYLDFDGQTVSGSIWNDNSGLPNAFYAAWTIDSDRTSFNDSERTTIQSIWQRVAEDYAPFDVDVTTADPGADALTRSSPNDPTFGTRALFTQSEVAHKAVCGGSCGGVAYVGTFDATTSTANYVQPAWIFPQGLGPNNAKFMAEAAAHEVGHTLGLGHDGTSEQGYYAGQGSWAPIMGVGYGQPITQWSRGEYADANNQQDDYAVMHANGLAGRADEAGSSTATAAPLSGRTAGGFVNDPTDQDVYAVDRPCSTPFTVTAKPAPTSPDLDIRLRLLDASGAVIAAHDPASGGSGDVSTGMSASIGTHAGPGTFYVTVDGVGRGDPATTGYSNYGSLGHYTVSLSSTCSAVPTAPEGVKAKLGEHSRGRSVHLRWTAPAYDGGSSVTGYKIKKLRLSAQGAVLRRIVTDPISAKTLQRDVTVPRVGRWAFRVRAINDAGAGSVSPRSNIVRVG